MGPEGSCMCFKNLPPDLNQNGCDLFIVQNWTSDITAHNVLSSSYPQDQRSYLNVLVKIQVFLPNRNNHLVI
jgi:hypothetical protein